MPPDEPKIFQENLTKNNEKCAKIFMKSNQEIIYVNLKACSFNSSKTMLNISYFV
jgi:hypothetical protein